MKIYVVGDSQTQEIDIVRLDDLEDAHNFYLSQKDACIGHLSTILEATDVPAIYRKWIKDAIDLIKQGEI